MVVVLSHWILWLCVNRIFVEIDNQYHHQFNSIIPHVNTDGIQLTLKQVAECLVSESDVCSCLLGVDVTFKILIFSGIRKLERQSKLAT